MECWSLVFGALLFVLAVGPLILTPGLGLHFDVAPKVAVALGGTAVALVAAMRRREWPAPGKGARLLLWLLGIGGLSLAVSTVASADPALSFFGGTWRRLGLLGQGALLVFAALLAFAVAERPERVRGVLRTMVLAGLAAAVYGVLQYFGWDPLIPPELYHVGEGETAIVRPPGPLGHASYFATHLLYVTFAGVGLARWESDSWWRWAGLAAAILGPSAILLSGTRAALLGLMAGSVFLLAARPVRWGRRAALVGALAAVSAVMFYVSPAGERLRGRVEWALEDPAGGGRLPLWRDAGRMALERPLTGWGPETFPREFPQFQSAELANAYPDFYWESPHNIVLDAWVAQGLPGLALLLALGGAALWVAWRNRRGDPLAFAASGAALAAAIVSQQFTSFTLPGGLLFYATAALALARAQWPGWPAVPAVPWPGWLRRMNWPGLALAAIAFGGGAVQLLVTDFALARVRGAIQAGDSAAASAWYATVRTFHPPGSTADLWYSRLLIEAAAGWEEEHREIAAREAFEAARRAPAGAEDVHNALYHLATVFAYRNDALSAEASLRSAIGAAPAWFKPRWVLAGLLAAQHRDEEALEQAEAAARLNGGRDPEVAETLARIREAAKPREP